MTSTLSPASLNSADDLCLLRGDRVELVLADVDDGEHAAVGQQEVRRERLASSGLRPARYSGRPSASAALAVSRLAASSASDLSSFGWRCGLLESLLDRLEVGESELDLDDAEVLDRVGRAGDVVVDERPQHEHDRVDLADVGEELVAEALALAGALDEPADVDDLDRGVHDVLRLRHRRQPVEPLVGHLGDADVRVLGGERVRRGEGAAAGECVVQRTLARVGEPDEAETFHEPSEATEPPDRPSASTGRPRSATAVPTASP